jgi:putative ABC transport system ATP-binding protein
MLIELKAVTKEYRLPNKELFNALTESNLAVASGDMIALTGPSGSGKTTLLSILGLLTKPSYGEVFWQGEAVNYGKDSKLTLLRGESIGFVFQFPSLQPTLTVMENVLLPQVFAGGVTSVCTHKAEELLELVALADQKKKYPYQLSGGQQRRVALARSLIRNPQCLLADEPTGALDAATGLAIMELLVTLNRMGKTIIYATHDQSLVKFSQRQLQVEAGQVSEKPAATY